MNAPGIRLGMKGVMESKMQRKELEKQRLLSGRLLNVEHYLAEKFVTNDNGRSTYVAISEKQS